jgi:hypothetical protein
MKPSKEKRIKKKNKNNSIIINKMAESANPDDHPEKFQEFSETA